MVDNPSGESTHAAESNVQSTGDGTKSVSVHDSEMSFAAFSATLCREKKHSDNGPSAHGALIACSLLHFKPQRASSLLVLLASTRGNINASM